MNRPSEALHPRDIIACAIVRQRYGSHLQDELNFNKYGVVLNLAVLYFVNIVDRRTDEMRFHKSVVPNSSIPGEVRTGIPLGRGGMKGPLGDGHSYFAANKLITNTVVD